MAGHSHAKNVANKKNAMDKKKAKVFMRIARIISVAVKEGKSNNPDFNPKLRLALKIAQNANTPKDIIKKALEAKNDPTKKIETTLYEGYLDGVAILTLINTDNPNKTAPEIRNIFSKANGNLGEPNSVVFMFDKISKIECKVEGNKEEDFFLEAAGLGAVEIKGSVAKFPPEQHHQAQIELEKNWEILFAGIEYEANTFATKGNLEAIEKLIENLEGNENVEACWHNYPEGENEDEDEDEDKNKNELEAEI